MVIKLGNIEVIWSVFQYVLRKLEIQNVESRFATITMYTISGPKNSMIFTIIWISIRCPIMKSIENLQDSRTKITVDGKDQFKLIMISFNFIL